MVEMLGVLAIIGVLSVGGIAGYTMAMRKYRANNLVDCIAKMSMAAQALPSTAEEGPDFDDYCSSDSMGGCAVAADPFTGDVVVYDCTDESVLTEAQKMLGDHVGGDNDPAIDWDGSSAEE